MYVVLIGPPGSGKGTQSRLISEKYGLQHLSTGELLRQEVAAGTEAGVATQTLIENGRLAPDELMVEMVSHRIAEPKYAQGCLFDGFPRTIEQVEMLRELLDRRGARVSAALEFQTPIEELLRRLGSRGRADDRPDVLRRRLEDYGHTTAPVVEYYRNRGLLHTIDALGEEPEVFERIGAVLDAAESSGKAS